MFIFETPYATDLFGLSTLLIIHCADQSSGLMDMVGDNEIVVLNINETIFNSNCKERNWKRQLLVHTRTYQSA
jgi:hypothetical protein